MNQRIRAKIRPFQHDNRIRDIVSQVHLLTTNLQGLKPVLELPRHTIKPQYPINRHKWSVASFGTDGRAKSKHQYDNTIKPSPYAMPHVINEYRGGLNSIL